MTDPKLAKTGSAYQHADTSKIFLERYDPPTALARR
jgi:hypothetical protein